jgi:hypothetical protein
MLAYARVRDRLMSYQRPLSAQLFDNITDKQQTAYEHSQAAYMPECVIIDDILCRNAKILMSHLHRRPHDRGEQTIYMKDFVKDDSGVRAYVM